MIVCDLLLLFVVLIQCLEIKKNKQKRLDFMNSIYLDREMKPKILHEASFSQKKLLEHLKNIDDLIFYSKKLSKFLNDDLEDRDSTMTYLSVLKKEIIYSNNDKERNDSNEK